ncbi:MAG TPA: hypothetical protein VG148_05320 [Pyrinomonadaceae bacterium]|nr:hypothetical protein [Pyrinomonadaceae bacterium]
MQTGTTAAHALHPARPEQKVEVVFEDGERVALRYSTWTEGLGWCCQKTIRVDAEQLDELHRALTVARHRLSRRRADKGEPPRPAQVIQLPSLS